MQIWNVSGSPGLVKSFSQAAADQNFWFQTKDSSGNLLFTAPAAGTFSTQFNRNILYGPGFRNFNLGVFKNFAVTERQGLQFRAEMFNWINHPNWGGSTGGGVDINPRSATFGK